MSQENFSTFQATRNSPQILPQLPRHEHIPVEPSPLGFLDSFGTSTRQNTKEDSYLTNYLPNPRATASALPYGMSDLRQEDIPQTVDSRRLGYTSHQSLPVDRNDSYSPYSRTSCAPASTPWTLPQTSVLDRGHDRHIHNERLEQLGHLPNHHPFSTFSPHQPRPTPLDTRYDYPHTEENTD